MSSDVSTVYWMLASTMLWKSYLKLNLEFVLQDSKQTFLNQER